MDTRTSLKIILKYALYLTVTIISYLAWEKDMLLIFSDDTWQEEQNELPLASEFMPYCSKVEKFSVWLTFTAFMNNA